MTIGQLTTADLDAGIAGLVGEAAVIALVPATDDRTWAAAMAWRIARALAAAGRRTALVDCFVNDPILHDVAGASNDEGLVDAFEYGASLQRIVQAQPDSRLFFISAGTFAPDPTLVTSHPRLKRISAGFRHEEALLLLFCPDEALAGLAAEPDGMIVLAPEGLDTAIAAWPRLANAVASGRPTLLGVIAEETPPPPLALVKDEVVAAPPPPEPEPAAPEPAAPPVRRSRNSVPMAMLLPPQRSHTGAVIITLVVLAALGAAGWVYRAPLLALAGLTPAAAPAPARPAADSTHRAAAIPAVDTLPFVVNLSQWSSPDDAWRVADTLEGHGWKTIITPLRQQGRVWYRVDAGPVPSQAAADSLLAAIRAHGLAAPDGGSVLNAPLSIALPGHYTAGAAETERFRLRNARVPAFVLGQADGTYRLYAGAVDAAPAAVLLQSLLTPAGGTGTLGPRVGFLP